MSFRYGEKPLSRSVTTTPESQTLRYWASGESDANAVKWFMAAATASAIVGSNGFLFRQDIRVTPTATAFHDVEIPYAEQKKENGEWDLDFSTLGGTVHIRGSKETLRKYPEGAFDYKGLINVSENGGEHSVEGTEQVIPALQLVFNFKHPMGVISLPQIRNLSRKTAYVNDRPWMGFEEGEVLFLGVAGKMGSNTPTSCAYHIACSENATLVNFGKIADVVKGGHEFAWIKYKNTVSGGKAGPIPESIHVERIYEKTNLGALFGFGG